MPTIKIKERGKRRGRREKTFNNKGGTIGALPPSNNRIGYI
jgi:hypothetical protein